MDMINIPFGTTDWSQVEATEHPGETGTATWRTREFGSLRVRMVDYTPGYLADHWCDRGHILLVLEGTLTTELAGGESVTLTAGSSYQVGDDTRSHRSSTRDGARLFIVD
ncbi:DHCW motif cupin fold protein [Streptomyces sp. ISL-43]|uniref:DHCW motif cupin fold protein n=1 Tax=Streptomyces sp. ISL-43 TaxID=2819183 RepID=UPI001C1D866D|nr:DHCW motif cupin fold protein [Streptomyces sp. ISL-43]MBT2450849.1 DHCW motif cupin fold protein [Streptomyces sp. ISL-43]